MTSEHSKIRSARLAMAFMSGLMLVGCEGSTGAAARSELADASATSSVSVDDDTNQQQVYSFAGSYLAGIFAERRRDSEAAATYYGRALAADPANPDLLRRTMLAMLSERRLDEASDVAIRLLAEKEDSPVARVALASHSVAKGDYATADEWLRNGGRPGFHRFLMPLLQAWARQGMGDSEGAFAVLSPLSEVSTFAPVNEYHTALIADLLGDPRQAETAFANAMGAVRGGSLRVVQAAGRFFERAGRTDEARAIYESYQDQNRDSLFFQSAFGRLDNRVIPNALVSTVQQGFAEALYGVAQSLNRENAGEAALIYTQLAHHLRPDLDVAQLLLGDIFASREQYKKATEAYGGITKSSPLNWTARLRLANNLDRMDDIDGAATVLRGMAVERPERPDPLINLGEVYRTGERYEEAITAYNQALARIPTLTPDHWTLLYARGMSFERAKRWPEAEKDFLKALDLQPEQPLVLNYLGYSWVEQGINLVRARAMIEKAVEQRPNDGYIVDSLGWVLYRVGRYDEALPHLERAVELRPTDPVIMSHFGDVLWRVGRKIEAVFQWRRAMSFDPDPEELKKLEDRLENGLPEEDALNGGVGDPEGS